MKRKNAQQEEHAPDDIIERAEKGDVSLLKDDRIVRMLVPPWDAKMTVLHLLARSGVMACLYHPDVAILTDGYNQRTPLHDLAHYCRSSHNFAPISKHPAAALIKDVHGNTPLHLIAKRDNQEGRWTIVKHPNAGKVFNVYGYTPLQIVATDLRYHYPQALKMALAIIKRPDAVIPCEDTYTRGNTTIHILLRTSKLDEASESDKLTLFGTLLKAPFVAKIPNKFGDTPLHLIAKAGYRKVLDHPDAFKVQNKDKRIPAEELIGHLGSEPSDEAIFQRLKKSITHGILDRLQTYAAGIAMRPYGAGVLDIPGIEEGGNVLRKLIDRWTELEEKTKDLLIKHSMLSKVPTRHGSTPLHNLAETLCYSDVGRISELADRPDMDSVKNDEDETPLDILLRLMPGHLLPGFLKAHSGAEQKDTTLFALAKRGNPKILENPKVATLVKGGTTPLHLFADTANGMLALKHPSIAKVYNDNGYTPLHTLAIAVKDKTITSKADIALLLKHPLLGRVPTKNYYKNTPLHFLAEGSIAVILKHPDVNKIKNGDGRTPLDVFVRHINDSKSLKEFVQAVGSQLTSFDSSHVSTTLANHFVDPADVALVLKFPIVPDNVGRTALHILANNVMKIEAAALIIKHPNAAKEKTRDEGNTALHILAKNYYIEYPSIVAKLIAAHPQAARVQNRDGDTPLHTLARECRIKGIEAINAVLEHPEVNRTKNQKGETPLSILARAGVKLVLNHPEYANIKDQYPPNSFELRGRYGRGIRRLSKTEQQEAMVWVEKHSMELLGEICGALDDWYGHHSPSAVKTFKKYRSAIAEFMDLNFSAQTLYRGLSINESKYIAEFDQQERGDRFNFKETREGSSWSTSLIIAKDRFAQAEKLGIVVEMLEPRPKGEAGKEAIAMFSPPDACASWFNHLYNDTHGSSLRIEESEYGLIAPMVYVELVYKRGQR
jgi:ankyrin repeat protein